MKTVLNICTLLATLCSVLSSAAEDASVTFVTKPSTLMFNVKKDRITSTQLGTLICTVMGFTVNQKNSWTGAYITNPFHPPRVVVGVKTGTPVEFEGLSGTKIPLKETLNWDNFYSHLVEISEKRLNNMKTDYLTVPKENSVELPAASLLDRLSQDVIENGSITPIIYFVDMTHTSLITSEINENMKKLEESVTALGGIMFLVKSDDQTHHHTRRTRQAPTTPAPAPSPKEYNLSPDYDEDYPVIFNILLFIGISLAITTLAICVAIASMDPGRDSLIYRVTSAQRFKKDN